MIRYGAVDLSSLSTPMELRDAHIKEAVLSSVSMEALLNRFAEISKPGKGAPVILAALARMGTAACEWVDGELRIEITGDRAATKISCSSSIGAGFRERIFKDKTIPVPFDEFPRMIERVPKLIVPLAVKQTETRIVLTASSEVRKTTMPPPMVRIDESSLMTVTVPKPAKTIRDDAATLVPPSARPEAKKVVLRRRVRDDAKK